LNEITLKINNETIKVPKGSTLATAIFISETKSFRRSFQGENRFPLCGMGICFECRVEINGLKHQRSCQILAEEGMVIKTDEKG
jgi:sarcosine oxidase subunit alpha